MLYKWNKILYNGGIDYGKKNCPLCKKYYYFNCFGCPIRKYTGYAFCKNTPYEEWNLHQYLYHSGVKKIWCSVCIEIAKKEIEFLRKVCEKYEK